MKSICILVVSFSVLLSGCTGDRRGAPPGPSGDAGTPPPPDGDATAPPMTTPPTMPPRSGECEGIPAEGLCEGDVLRFCRDGVPEALDCTSLYPAPARGTCTTVDSLGGAVCALQPGDPCMYTTTSGEEHTAPCAGTNAGCVWTDSGNECRENVGTCSADSVVCLGDNLMYGCLKPPGTIGQPTLIDCGDLGGSCSAPSCIGLPEDSACVLPTLLCGEDLSCEDSVCVADDPITIRSCSDSTASGACTNTADCAIIDGDPEGIFMTGIGCLSDSDVGACVASMTGLSAGCADCFANPEGSAFEACAGF